MSTDAKKSELPPWIGDYFRQAYDSHERLIRVIYVSRRGISGVTALPRLTRAIARVEGRAEDADELKAVEEQAELAKTEVEDDFPVLHSLATGAIWSWLEHLVKGLLVERLVHDRKALQLPAFQRIKVRLSDYVSLNRREQAAYLVELLEQETASPLKRGANRFESLLEPFGLSGSVDEQVTKTLFELQQVRNAIAHQNGRCDRRLKTSCPWLKLKIGEPIKVSGRQLKNYANATAEYALGVLYRIGDGHGVNLRSDLNDDA